MAFRQQRNQNTRKFNNLIIKPLLREAQCIPKECLLPLCGFSFTHNRCTRPENRPSPGQQSTVPLSHRIIGGMLCYRCNLESPWDWEVSLCVFYFRRDVVFGWQDQRSVSLRATARGKRDRSVAQRRLISSMTGFDSRFCVSSSRLSRSLTAWQQPRAPRSRCGAKGVLRHVPLS